MAPLPPYSYASVPLILVSLWHAICSSNSYGRSSTLFHARSWHPLPRLRYGELLAETLALVAAAVYHGFTVFGTQSGSETQILGLQQLVMLVFFIVVFFLILVNESTLAFSLPQDFNFLLLGFSFSVESFVAVCSATDPNLLFELESFRILAALAGFSALTCFLLAWKPVSFMVSITFSASLALQGSWLLQMGLSLYSDEFLPEGCHHLSNGHTQCDIAVADHRAVALMDLLLIIHIICILLVFVAAYGISYRKPGHTRRHSGYEFVDGNGEVDQLQMRQLPTKVVID